ncbi:MAG TPA: HEAT repeat domain-containing protein [Vicinamibacterales bacterium]|nr:HEAT repeat domain-containing protein [Vicinamibacterales bacterium]
MADAPTLSPEASRSVSALARTLVTAARSWALYPPDHPAVRGSLDRLRLSIAEATRGQIFAFGVTPDTLLFGGIAVGGRDAGTIAEAARWLHDRDILQLTFAGEVTLTAVQRLLGVLSEDSRIIRRRGGPAKVWAEEGDAAIAVEQIDFSQVLEDREITNPVRRKDDLWRSIVRGVLDRKKPTDAATQARLLEISGDVMAIGELAGDVIAPHHAMDGSPMLTSQAAAVVAAYHHLVGIVDVLSPERKQEVMQNLAAATTSLNPHVVMQMLAGGGAEATPAAGVDPGSGTVVTGIIDAMDDNRVAQLLATTLAIEGQASERLATVFNTIATDDDRKSRVLTLTRRMLSETDFGRQDAFQSLWSSMEELLLTYNEKPFVSASYRTGLDQIGARADQMASDVPAELVELLDTLGQDNVRRLSVRLLIDLLTLEKDPARAPEIARDVAALTEDLLLAGDYESTLAVVTALQTQAADPAAVAGPSCRVALDGVVNTVPFVETADLLNDMTDAEAAIFADICTRIGPASTDSLKGHLESEEETPGRLRATAVIKQFGGRAVGRLASLVGSAKWAAQRNAADVLGEIGATEGVPLLQPLLRGQDLRVTTAAVRALSNIKDPAAARAVHTVLRAATGEQRRAVVDALVAQRDARVVPVLVRILEDSDPFGGDHAIVLDTLGALAKVGDDQAVPALAALMRKKKLLAPKKTRALKEQSLAALRAIKTPAATGAIADAAKTGDRMLRRLARAGG